MVFAQDPKFSQYFASPQTLNPALIGYYDGNYRIALNTRRQWENIGDPYVTTSISGELKLNDEYYFDDVFSIGVNGLFEESFNKILKANIVNVGFSYYKYFDADHKFKLGLAPQIGYVSKKLDYNVLTFSSQYNNGVFDPSMPNYLNADLTSIAYLDINLGANFAVSLEHIKMYLGYSAYHITNPRESLFKETLERLPIRQTVSFGFRYLSNDLVDLSISAHQMKQQHNNNEIIGTVFGLKPTYDAKAKFNIGLWHNFNENTYFPYLGLEISNFSVGINYTISTNKIIENRPRTFELSLIISDKNVTKFINTCKF